VTAFIDRLRLTRPLLWLDATAYAGRLLARDQVPWLEPAEYIAWQRKTQLLLDSDVIGVSLEQLGTAWARAHPALQTAMTAKPRLTCPLRALLSDAAFRQHAAGLVQDLRRTFADRMLALLVPTPRAWVAGAYALAHGIAKSAAVDDDDADSAAAYLADFLRSFADCAADVLLLQESPASSHITLNDPSYVPVANLAVHYRWSLGVHGAMALADGPNPAVSFVITPPPVTFPVTGIAVPAGFWFGTCRPQMTGNFLFAEIPTAIEPERVLERLTVLRAC
jgi:hypothetical protein